MIKFVFTCKNDFIFVICLLLLLNNQQDDLHKLTQYHSADSGHLQAALCLWIWQSELNWPGE